MAVPLMAVVSLYFQQDSDVLAESEKVRKGEISENDIVVIKNLQKVLLYV